MGQLNKQTAHGKRGKCNKVFYSGRITEYPLGLFQIILCKSEFLTVGARSPFRLLLDFISICVPERMSFGQKSFGS